MTSAKAANVFFDEKKRNGAQMKSQQMRLGTGRLYVIKMDVRLSYMKSFHAKCKFHDYTKVKLWNDFGVKWSDSKTGLQNFIVTLNPSLK